MPKTAAIYPDTIVWKGISLKKEGRKPIFCGSYPPFSVTLKKINGDLWSSKMCIYGLNTEERLYCYSPDEIQEMMDACFSGLRSLFSDGLEIISNLTKEINHE